MKADLNFKQRQMNDAGDTAARLQVEVEQKKQELEKIKSLEGKIEKEMQQVAEGIEKMTDEMNNKFSRTNEVTAQAESDKRRLKLIKHLVAQYKNGLAKQATYHGMYHDTRKNQILNSDIYNKLNDVEKRLIANES